MIRICLLEPDYWRGQGLAAALAEPGRMEVCDDLESADVVLVALQTVIRTGLPQSGKPVLSYGEEDSAQKAAEALASGACGYFALSSDPATLRAAIEAVAAGRLWAPRSALRFIAGVRHGEEGLDSHHLELLALLNEGLSNKEIGNRLGLAEATVKARMNRLYRRFGVASRLQLLAAAFRDGILKP